MSRETICIMDSKVVPMQPVEHTGRFRLLVAMPDGYGIDVSWSNRRGIEKCLALLVETIQEEGGIDNAIPAVVDALKTSATLSEPTND